jgi:hypothetical protein
VLVGAQPEKWPTDSSVNFGRRSAEIFGNPPQFWREKHQLQLLHETP